MLAMRLGRLTDMVHSVIEWGQFAPAFLTNS